MINLLNDYLTNRKQRVVIDGNSSSWVDIPAGVPQGPILRRLLFLVYFNDFSDGLKSQCESDDTFLFAIAHDNNTSVSDINKDLKLISNWVFQWKMSYNQHLSMQPQEITKFSLYTN